MMDMDIDIDIGVDGVTGSRSGSGSGSRPRPTFTHMIFSGGGFLGLTYLGIIRYLQQEHMDKHIKTVAGTSVGATFAACFALGVPYHTIEEEFSSLNEDFIKFNLESILNMGETMGLTNAQSMVSKFGKYVGNMTFIDFAKHTGKNLIVCATHVETMTPVYFCVDRTPHVRVIDAVAASMAIPMIVSPVKIGDDYYIDGAVTHNVPVRCIPFDVHKECVLIINVDIEVKGFDMNADHGHGTNQSAISRVIKYASHVITAATSNMQAKQLIKSQYPYYMYINDAPVGQLEFVVDEDTSIFRVKLPDKTTVENCMLHGYNKMYMMFNVVM